MYLEDNLWDRARAVVAAANDGRITGVPKTLGGLFGHALGPLLDELTSSPPYRNPEQRQAVRPAPGRLPTGRKD